MRREVEGRILRIIANIGVLALIMLALSFLNINIPSILTLIPREGFTFITAIAVMITIILFFVALRIILDLMRLVDIASNTLLKHIPGFNPEKSPSVVRALKEISTVLLTAIALSIATPLISSIPEVGGWLNISITIAIFIFSLVLLYDAGKTLYATFESSIQTLIDKITLQDKNS
ncbi:MAG: hypothetical protein RMJ00_01120 [Nitrososphaerota archaeon]|nr:hypothetical protein [Candidatus Bathyarchaeota archaeon]MCX8161876.1 hypothetical protein [Candidatus Bathyarchaeota archaeon]MDW8061288.1 hypothetical protein [Nitrososphaerota archaeon]